MYLGGWVCVCLNDLCGWVCLDIMPQSISLKSVLKKCPSKYVCRENVAAPHKKYSLVKCEKKKKISEPTKYGTIFYASNILEEDTVLIIFD